MDTSFAGLTVKLVRRADSLARIYFAGDSEFSAGPLSLQTPCARTDSLLGPCMHPKPSTKSVISNGPSRQGGGRSSQGPILHDDACPAGARVLGCSGCRGCSLTLPRGAKF